MKKKEIYYVWVSVTPYVRQYLLDNYGVEKTDIPDLVDIRKDSLLNALFTPKLVKKSFRREKDLEENARNQRRNCRMRFLISHDIFVRHGWAISLTDEGALNKALEIRCKTILLTYLSSLYAMSGNLSYCITRFYRKFNMNDEIWPVDSIRKLWLRDKKIPKNNVFYEFEQKISTFILEKLSENGTISAKALETYENN